MAFRWRADSGLLLYAYWEVNIIALVITDEKRFHSGVELQKRRWFAVKLLNASLTFASVQQRRNTSISRRCNVENGDRGKRRHKG